MVIRSIILAATVLILLTSCPKPYYTASSINLPPGAEVVARTIGDKAYGASGPFDLTAFDIAVLAQFKVRTGWSSVVAHYDSSLGNGGYTLLAVDDPLYSQVAKGENTGDALRLYNIPDTGKYVLVADIYAMLREDRSPSVSPDYGMYIMAVMDLNP